MTSYKRELIACGHLEVAYKALVVHPTNLYKLEYQLLAKVHFEDYKPLNTF